MFADRADAGRRLAALLAHLAGRDDVLVLGLPRGGVPVAAPVAAALGAPLDVFVVRKLGVPVLPELAMGAVASGGTLVLNDDVVRHAGVSADGVEAVARRERAEVERRERAYRGDRPAPDPRGLTVVLVDDGLATGSTMRAAIAALGAAGAAAVVVAVPVGPPETCAALAREVDELVCPLQPGRFRAVGQWYRDFSEVSDAEVRALLDP